MTIKFNLPQEPNKKLIDDENFRWINQLWRHIRGGIEWSDFVFQNGWVDYYVPAFSTAKYRAKSGITYITFVIKSGTSGSVMFTLPEGFRPGHRITFLAETSSGIIRIDVLANGDVTHMGGGTLFVSLTCSFIAEQ